jgi:hypothetical protein
MPGKSKQTTRTSTQTASKSTTDGKSELDDKEPLAAGVKKVTRQTTERFIEQVDIPRAKEEAATIEFESDEREDCPHCHGSFLIDAVEDNDGYCPGCGYDSDGVKREDPPTIGTVDEELSEAEILLQSIADDDAYRLLVERLINYDTDPRTDSRAAKEFCTTLTPVTLDYLDIVRRSFGGGAFRFTMFKRGRPGILKSWVEVIAKPVIVPAAEPHSTALTTQGNGTEDKLRTALDRALARRLDEMVDDLLRPKQRDENSQSGPAAVVDTDALVAKKIFENPAIIDGMARKFQERLGITEPEHWSTPLIKAGVEQLPRIIDTLQMAFTPNGTSNEAAQAVQRIARRIAVDITDGVPPRVAVHLAVQLINANQSLRPQVDQILSAPPEQLINLISQQTQVNLSQVPHSANWISEFQSALRAALTLPQKPVSEPPAVAGGPSPGPSAPPTPGSAPPKPEDEKAFARLLRGIAADMSRSHCVDAAQAIADPDNADPFFFTEPDDAVSETLALLEKFPAHRATVSMIELAPPEVIVSQVAQAVDDETLTGNQGAILYAHHFKTTLVAALGVSTASGSDSGWVAANEADDEAESTTIQSQTTA